jgi:DNA polymerase
MQDADGVSVRFYPDLDSWLCNARALLARGVAPARVWWHEDHAARREAAPRVRNVERAFVDEARYAACHRNDDRWALLYQLAWRLHHGEAQLLELSADPDVVRLRRYAKSVRRDRHKMKAFVRFREVDDGQVQPRYVAWFEPDHHIVELTAPFFKRRFANMRWSILTPERCAHWEGSGALWFSDGVDKSAAPDGDRLEDAWRIYYKSIFNPARLKTSAMRAEMPQKYWKNLPEAHLIPGLIRDANRRVDQMTGRQKQDDVLQCGPRPPSPQRLLDDAHAAAPAGSLEQLALGASACRDCALWQPATQVVFGEGPGNADIMLIGEQPGDHEDLAGRPFVGPSGQLLDRALAEAGISRSTLYVTNAVKHFGFVACGRRRMHSKPTIESVRACMSWLQREIAAVQPGLLVCLGVTAATAVLGEGVTLRHARGKFLSQDGRDVLVTAHPAFVLRQRDRGRARREYRHFVQDLVLASEWRDASA